MKVGFHHTIGQKGSKSGEGSWGGGEGGGRSYNPNPKHNCPNPLYCRAILSTIRFAHRRPGKETELTTLSVGCWGENVESSSLISFDDNPEEDRALLVMASTFLNRLDEGAIIEGFLGVSNFCANSEVIIWLS